MENHALEQKQPPSHADRVTTPFTQGGLGRAETPEPTFAHEDRRGRRSLQAQACSGGETQAVARKLLRRVEKVLDGEEALNPQAMKHISGILKDVRDILTVREDSVDSGAVTVEMEKSVEEFAG